MDLIGKKISFSTEVDLVGCRCTPTICFFDLNRHIYVVILAYRFTFSVGRFLHYHLQSDSDTVREELRHEALNINKCYINSAYSYCTVLIQP
jgi:hypothetical protein